MTGAADDANVKSLSIRRWFRRFLERFVQA